MNTAPFAGTFPDFSDFLKALAGNAMIGNDRFVARNFLIDEGVTVDRAESYRASGAARDHGDLDTWVGTHEDYLFDNVYCDQPVTGPPMTLDTSNRIVCPETFRSVIGDEYAAVDGTLDVIRVESLTSIAKLADVNENTLFGWAASACQETRENSAHAQVLDAALSTWSSRLQMRPVFCAFWEDQSDLFGIEPKADHLDWANVLRDRLGLYHLSGTSSNPSRILLFKYPVRSLPRVKGAGRSPCLVAPTVLDARFSVAFCPAPRFDSIGRTVDLSANEDTTHRELLHPFIRLSASHLYRVGHITADVPRNLAKARSMLITWLRLQSGRNDYAALTDGDTS